MDFVPCPRCQEMNPPNVVKCTACGASMDEEPIEVTPLALVQEPEGEEGAAEPPTAAPPLPAAAPPLATAVAAPTQRPADVPHLATATAPPHATPAAAAAHVERPPGRTPHAPAPKGGRHGLRALRPLSGDEPSQRGDVHRGRRLDGRLTD